MRVTEPMTMITDYVMGALALALALRLVRAGAVAGQVPVLLWAGALAATALASFAGGTYHGFVQMMPAATARLLWKLTIFSTGVGSACLLAAVASAGTTGWVHRAWLAFVVAKLVVYAWWMSSHDDFIYVIYDYGSALVLMLAIVWLSQAAPATAAAPWLTAGVAVSVVAGAIQAFKVAPHPHFNHNDLFHVVQMGALYLLYRGGLLLGTGPSRGGSL